MQIKITRFDLSRSAITLAFFDIEVDGWIRFQGLNLHRDGKVRSAQLTWTRAGKKHFRSAIEIPDPDLAQLVMDEIAAALQAYIAALPESERSLPPTPPRLKPAPVKPATKPPLSPPLRLLAGMPRRKERTA